MRTLKLEINCGEKTCAAEPKVFCTFLRSRMDGSNPFCHLFEQRLRDTNGDGMGWVLRCKECLAATEQLVNEGADDGSALRGSFLESREKLNAVYDMICEGGMAAVHEVFGDELDESSNR